MGSGVGWRRCDDERKEKQGGEEGGNNREQKYLSWTNRLAGHWLSVRYQHDGRDNYVTEKTKSHARFPETFCFPST